MPFLLPFIPAIATVGAAALGASAANSASKSAADSQNQATQASLAAQQAALDRITQIESPFISAGSSVLSPLAQRVMTGAPNFSAPSYALPLGSHAAATAGPVMEHSGVDVAQPMGGAPGVAGSPTAPTNPVQSGPTPTVPVSQLPPNAGVPQAQPQAQSATPQPDWDAYLAQNPDVAARAQQGVAQGLIGPGTQWATPEDWAAFHYQNTGQAEGRQLPMKTPTGPATDPNAPPPGPLDLGTASPVVADFQRPDQPNTPTFGPSPNAADYLDESKFTASPGYQWRLQQGQRNLNANFGARGLLKSGGAIQGALDYGQNQASNEFQNWFNRQQTLYGDVANQYNTDRASGLNQFNLDRNNLNNNFSEDRSYGTNLAINNRDFANNQYNAQTQNLFQLAGIGTQAAGAIAGANNTYANNASNLFTAQGNNQAQNALAQGNTDAQLFGTIGSTVGNLFSAPSRNTGGTPIPTQTAPSYGVMTPPFAGYAGGLSQPPSYSYGGTY